MDAEDLTKTASLYYVETGIQETDETKDDGIDQTKLFLERNVATDQGVSTTTFRRVAVIQVTIDNAAAFAHIHYGLWNGLTGDRGNVVADLGTGFVTAQEGMSMTDPDHQAVGGRPNFGDATYDGNWVANIQEADGQGDGAITRHSDKSSMFADFVNDKVTVSLTGLATLAGDISGNTFSGDSQPTLSNTLPPGLANADDFMGSFSGGFLARTQRKPVVSSTTRSTDNKTARSVFLRWRPVRTTHRRSDYLKTRAADPNGSAALLFSLPLHSALRSAGALHSAACMNQELAAPCPRSYNSPLRTDAAGSRQKKIAGTAAFRRHPSHLPFRSLRTIERLGATKR